MHSINSSKMRIIMFVSLLFLQLLVQEMNRGYDVEYSLKYVPGQPRQRTGEFQWELGEWEPCYDPCGEIQTNRTVKCASIITRHEAKEEDECDLENKPPSSQPCPTDNCQVNFHEAKCIILSYIKFIGN